MPTCCCPSVVPHKPSAFKGPHSQPPKQHDLCSEYDSRRIMYRWIRSVSEEIYRTPITLIFVIQTLVVSFVPYVGAPASFVLLCWLYALYCFEYKWMIEQWDWQKRRAYFERRWPYFLGFGTCSSLDCCSALPLPFPNDCCEPGVHVTASKGSN